MSGASKQDDELEVSFQKWWGLCPVKIGKLSALKLYRDIVRRGKATSKELEAGMQHYANQRVGADPRFTKHPSTWLRKGCWLDEVTICNAPDRS